MPRKRPTPEEIVAKIRHYHRQKTAQVKGLKELETERAP
jgi:hypothetical protein